MFDLKKVVEGAVETLDSNPEDPGTGDEDTSQPSETKKVKKEGKEENKEEDGEVVIENLETCPDELKPYAKQLLADYTRKTQDVASLRSKAAAFDDIVKDSDFQQFSKEKYGIGAGGQNTTTPSSGADDSIPELDIDLEDEYLDKNVKKLVEVVKSLKSKIGNLTSQVEGQETDKMISNLSEKFPDIEKKIPELLPLLKQGYSLKGAYMEKFGDQFLKEKMEKFKQKLTKDLEEEKDTSVLPNVSGGGKKDPVSSKIKSVRDAITKSLSEITE